MKFSWRDCHTRFINLEKRTDRLVHMTKELERVGLKAERFNALTPDMFPEAKYDVMRNRGGSRGGNIGCHMSQVAVMQKAYGLGKSAFVMEDDLRMASDVQRRLDYIENFCNTHEWDIVWLGSTFHYEPTWHKIENGKHTHPELKMCSCNNGMDWEKTDDPRIVRTFGEWGTYCYIVNYNSIPKILKLLDDNVHLSMGIDFLFILLQPQLKCYAMLAGSVIQIDGESNIGSGKTIFSSFRKLGRYWFSNTLQQYQPQDFYNGNI